VLTRGRRILGSLFKRRQFEDAMDEEMRFHLDARAEDLARSGLSIDEARRRARLEFGDVHNSKLDCREARGLRLADEVGHDLRFAIRLLAKTPAFTAAAILTLALGMGANALTFSAVNGLLLRPLPFQEPDDLVWVFAQQPQSSDERETISHDEGEVLARRTSPFAVTAAIGDAALVRQVERRHDRWLGIWATKSLLQVLRIAPVIGAVPAELPPNGSPRAMLISHERWVRDFGSDPSVVGRLLPFVDTKPMLVAGVLPPGLEFPFARAPHKGHGAGFYPGVQDFWILAPDRVGEHPGGVMIARLADGRTAATAATEVASVSTMLSAAHPESGGRTLIVVPMRDQVLGLIGGALPILQLFSALVLLIACANLGNLMLARAAAARADTAMRIALGARRAHLLRLSAAEALVISAGGASLGLALAWGGRELLAAMAPRHTALLNRITIDAAALAFLAAVSIVTTVVFGVLPGLRRPAGSLTELMSTARHTGRGVDRTLRCLAVSQIAFSLTLLTGAGVLGSSLQRLMNVDAGYVTDGVITADTVLYLPNRETTPVLAALIARLQSLPYVEAAGFVHSTPLTGKWLVRDTFEVMEGPAAGITPKIPGGFVTYDYFGALRIPILAGRAFDSRDLGRRDFPIIINDIAARRFFPDRNPVGTRVMMTGALREIVGVVKGTRDLRLDAAAEPQWYQPVMSGTSELIVRVSGRPTDRVAALRREIEAADPRMIVQRILPLDAIVADSVLERRMASYLVSVFAAVALVLAAVGLYGVMHFGVLRRRREFAIRSALGATRRTILHGVLHQSLVLAGVGIGLGVALSLVLAGMLQRLLFETRAASPTALGVAALLLAVIAIASAIQPAWRAAAADPVSVLKQE
jgi:predicted permease